MVAILRDRDDLDEAHLHECIQRVEPCLAVGIVVLRHCASVNGARVQPIDSR